MIWRLIKEAFSPKRPPDWAYEVEEQLPDDGDRIALIQDGLSNGRDNDLVFVRAALDGNQSARGVDLRRHGTPAPADRLRQLGVRSNTIMSEEFLAILTDKGLSDPIEAAHVIASAYLGRAAQTEAISRADHAGITMVEVIPNNMAAGPCQACLKLAEKPIPIEQAPLGPLPGCPHPGQCKLWTRSVLSFD
jgi:hypothetical protein